MPIPSPRFLTVLVAALAVQAAGASAQSLEVDGRTSGGEGAGPVERTVWPMGTRADLTGAASDVESAVREIERVEALLSTWDPSTPLSRFNAASPGTRHPADGELGRLLIEVEGWSERTGRAFDPAIGALVEAWGLRTGGRRPSDLRRTRAVAEVGRGVFDLSGGSLVRSGTSTWIDAGAFGKGYALRGVAAAGIPDLPLRVDLGGQLLCVGEGPCELLLAHPEDRTVSVVRLRLDPARFGPVRSAATSGNSERGIVVDGERLGHLLDPRTGRPVDFDGSVTVVGSDPLLTDLLSTALFVMGPVDGLALVRDLPGVEAIWMEVVDGDLRITTTEALAPLVERTGFVSQPKDDR